MKEYKIDYDLFSVEEIIKIINFFRLIELTKTKKINKDLIIERYHEYRNTLNNIALEKQYDKMLYQKSGVSIYETIKNLH
ncbi:MAG: UPF0223 family protein [Acholeplasmataceae bacterium]|nr:UPF0223 family protein [Acholeplasmataceae bacterium]